jgi:hypothetical protein
LAIISPRKPFLFINKKITETKEIIVEKIKINEKIIDAKCEIDPMVISILNEAAKKP